MERFRHSPRLTDDDVRRAVDDELEMHLELKREDLAEEGVPETEVEGRARTAFGDADRIREECVGIQTGIRRRRRRLERLEGLARDLRLALRGARRSPHYMFAVVVSLGLGIGAATTAFTMLDALLLRTLPYPEAEELGLVFERRPGEDLERDRFSLLQYRRWAPVQESFERTAVFSVQGGTVTGDRPAERLGVAPTSASLLPMLGGAPAHGRLLTAADDVLEAPVRAVLTHGLWQRRFGGDPSVVGSTITLDGEAVPVVGVLAADFPQEALRMWAGGIDVFTNLAGASLGPNYGIQTVLVRRRADLSWERAAADLGRFADLETARRGQDIRIDVVPLIEEVGGTVRPALFAIFGAAVLLLLVTCANVSTLLLSMAPQREREMALFSALGASRRQLFQRASSEHLLVAAAGTTLAVGVVAVVHLGLRSLSPDVGWIADRAHGGWRTIPWLRTVGLDGRGIAFTLGLAALSTLLFGLAPALVASRVDPEALIRGRWAVPRPFLTSRWRLSPRDLLTVGQIAFTLVLLIGAALLVQSFRRAVDTDLGFDPEHLLSMYVNPSGDDYGRRDARVTFYEEVLERVEALPGIEGAAMVDGLPLTGGVGWARVRRGTGPLPPRDDPSTALSLQRHVTRKYFEVMGISLRSGRLFDPGDRAGAPNALVVDQGLADRLWPEGSPLGEDLGGTCPEGCRWGEIVGVVEPVRYEPLETDPWIAAYDLIEQRGDGGHGVYLVARTTADPRSLMVPVREAVQSVDPDQPVIDVRTMEDRLADSLLTRRLSAVVVGSFALLALVLALLGLYGAIAHGVSRSRGSIAVRVALGARAGRIRVEVLRRALGLAGAGILLGLAASFGLTRLLGGVLYGVAPLDPVIFVLVPVVLLGTTVLASWRPAERAARVDPVAHFQTT